MHFLLTISLVLRAFIQFITPCNIKIGVTTCSSGAATKWYMNIDTPEVNAFRARYPAVPIIRLYSQSACNCILTVYFGLQFTGKGF